jgi:hypothetical protein
MRYLVSAILRVEEIFSSDLKWIAKMFLFSPDLCGGEGGIRTPDTLSGMPVFKTGAINHSATSPITTVLLQFTQMFDAKADRANCRVQSYFIDLMRLFKTEGSGMKFHDLGEVSQEIGQTVVAGIRMILVLHALLLKLFV